MVDLPHLQSVAWALTTALELALLFLLMRRKVVPNYPFFTSYLITAIFPERRGGHPAAVYRPR